MSIETQPDCAYADDSLVDQLRTSILPAAILNRALHPEGSAADASGEVTGIELDINNRVISAEGGRLYIGNPALAFTLNALVLAMYNSGQPVRPVQLRAINAEDDDLNPRIAKIYNELNELAGCEIVTKHGSRATLAYSIGGVCFVDNPHRTLWRSFDDDLPEQMERALNSSPIRYRVAKGAESKAGLRPLRPAPRPPKPAPEAAESPASRNWLYYRPSPPVPKLPPSTPLTRRGIPGRGKAAELNDAYIAAKLESAPKKPESDRDAKGPLTASELGTSAEDDWRHKALCRYVDPEIHFPVGTSGPALLRIAEAKTVCGRCPVVTECLNWALETGQDAGVWGGMSEDERRALKRRNARTRARTS